MQDCPEHCVSLNRWFERGVKKNSSHPDARTISQQGREGAFWDKIMQSRWCGTAVDLLTYVLPKLYQQTITKLFKTLNSVFKLRLKFNVKDSTVPIVFLSRLVSVSF